MCSKILQTIFVVFFINYNLNYSNRTFEAAAAATAVQINNKTASSSLQQNYASLREDVRWFFERMENLAGTVELMLPNVTAKGKDRNFITDTRMILLSGIKHMIIGTKELSITFRKSFETDHVRQFLQLKQVTNIVHDLIKTLKIWFGNLRALVSHLFSLYNYYIPEVLFGKCLGKYIVKAYPERVFYEYPLLLLTDIFNILMDSIESGRSSDDKQLKVLDDPLENEIPLSEQDDLTAFAFNVAGFQGGNEQNATDSIFNLSDVVATNKEAFIDKAADEGSLKKCLKLYTAETLIRQLKLYFFS